MSFVSLEKKYLPLPRFDSTQSWREEDKQYYLLCPQARLLIYAGITGTALRWNGNVVMVPDEGYAIGYGAYIIFHTDEVAEPNVFACEASIAAWIEGKDWLNQGRI